MLDIALDLRRYIEQEHGTVVPKQATAQVALLLGSEPPAERELLERLGKALRKEGIVVRIGTPPALEKRVIVSRATLQAHRLHHPSPFIIEDLRLFIDHPEERRTLWRELLSYVG